jgi:hypothetical protein
MTTFWTVMIITFGAGAFDGTFTGLPYKDPMTCGQHIDIMREQMEAQGLAVTMIQCKKLDRISASPRPKARP